MGYKELRNRNDIGRTEKEDVEFIRTRAMEVMNWFEALTTTHLIHALSQETERTISKVLTCDKAEDLKYLQGKIDALRGVMSRINALRETAKKFI